MTFQSLSPAPFKAASEDGKGREHSSKNQGVFQVFMKIHAGHVA